MEAIPYSLACLDCQTIPRGRNFQFHLLYRLSETNPMLLLLQEISSCRETVRVTNYVWIQQKI